MHPNDELVSSPRPRRRWLKRGLLFLVPVVLIGGACLSFYLAARSGWQEAIAEAEKDDPHWRFADRQARRPTWKDEENGALVVRSVKALIPKAWPAWDYGPETPPAGPDGSSTPVSPTEAERQALQDGFHNLEPPVQLPPRQLAALKEEMKKAEPAVAEARKLAQFPRGRFPIQYKADFISTVIDEIQDSRAVANLLSNDMLLRSQENDLPGALTSCHALLNLCRYLDEEPTSIAFLVRLAIRTIALHRIERVLAQGELEETDQVRLQRMLSDEEAVPSLLDSLRGERGGHDMMMEQMVSGNMAPGQVLSRSPNSTPLVALTMMLPGGMQRQRTELLRANNRIIAMVKLPFAERTLVEAQFAQDYPNLALLPRMMVSAHQKVIGAADRTQAELRCALAMLAAERYRRANGRWPADLEALTPQFLPKVPEDPFDGKPIRLRATADGLVIYSVGLDGTDDHGKLGKNPQEQGTDLGFRLYDVPKRRQPAKPQ